MNRRTTKEDWICAERNAAEARRAYAPLRARILREVTEYNRAIMVFDDDGCPNRPEVVHLFWIGSET